jgi:hypothetical protein
MSKAIPRSQMFAAKSLLLATPPVAPPVQFDAGSAGNSTASLPFGSSGTLSDTLNTLGNHILAWVSCYYSGTVTGVTHDGVAMTKVTSIQFNNTANNGEISLWKRAVTPAAGNKSIVATIGTAWGYACIFSEGYTGVNSVGSNSTAFGSSTQASIAGTCAAGEMLVEGAGVYLTTFTSGSGGTTRKNVGTSSLQGLYVQDSTSSTTFLTNMSTAAWGAIRAKLS